MCLMYLNPDRGDAQLVQSIPDAGHIDGDLCLCEVWCGTGYTCTGCTLSLDGNTTIPHIGLWSTISQ